MGSSSYMLHRDQLAVGHDGSSPSSSWPLVLKLSLRHHEPYHPAPACGQTCEYKDKGLEKRKEKSQKEKEKKEIERERERERERKKGGENIS